MKRFYHFEFLQIKNIWRDSTEESFVSKNSEKNSTNVKKRVWIGTSLHVRSPPGEENKSSGKIKHQVATKSEAMFPKWEEFDIFYDS